MGLNENLIRYRKKNHLTQEQLSSYLNVSRQAISKWETGQSNPSIDDLIKLSGLYNISIDELTGKMVPDKKRSAVNIVDNSNSKKSKFINTLLVLSVLYFLIIPLGGVLAVVTLVLNKKYGLESQHFYKLININCAICIIISAICILVFLFF